MVDTISKNIVLVIQMNLQELKDKTPADLILEAEKLEIENPSTMRKQEILICNLKKTCRKK